MAHFKTRATTCVGMHGRLFVCLSVSKNCMLHCIVLDSVGTLIMMLCRLLCGIAPCLNHVHALTQSHRIRLHAFGCLIAGLIYGRVQRCGNRPLLRIAVWLACKTLCFVNARVVCCSSCTSSSTSGACIVWVMKGMTVSCIGSHCAYLCFDACE